MITNKNAKRILFMFIVFFIFFTNSYLIFATNSITDQAKNWIQTGKESNPNEEEGITSIIGKWLDRIKGTEDTDPYEGFESLAGVLVGVGTFIIAIVGVILGIRLMFASADKKAQSKEALIIYLIGSIIIFGAVAIWKLLIKVLGNFI